jgi:hypothetical protein
MGRRYGLEAKQAGGERKADKFGVLKKDLEVIQ